MGNFMPLICIVLIIAVVVLAVILFIHRKKNKNGAKKDFYQAAVYQRETLGMKLRAFFAGKTLSVQQYADLEETLISCDIGAGISREAVQQLRKKNPADEKEAIELLKDYLTPLVKQEHFVLKDGCLNILLVLGVNGVGKTTSIAKIADYFSKQGKKVMLAAGDTFRAAATEQLTKWAAEMNIPIVKQGEGADPASVVFDAVDSACAKKIDLLIVDTAGRLHNKKNLMEELKKIYRIIENKGGCERRNMLVIDSTTGQNAYSQAEAFKEAVGIDLVMLTKYDAMSKGGIVFQISHRLGLPFSFVGTGEKRENIAPFDTETFISQIFE
ncbi:MAG: signal recognition particle-docking protein FtsY [Spirochaetales bacterium]|nr:signal recognition particle-docking protein FtsY [Spirochaetales bacterium]